MNSAKKTNSGFRQQWKVFEKSVREGIVEDVSLNKFLSPILPSESERKVFIRNCLTKLKTRRMLLRSQWYTEIADDQDRCRHGNVALRIVFLMAMAEALTRTVSKNKDLTSKDAILGFFEKISLEDKEILMRGFKRAFLGKKYHQLRFSSIIGILYDIRNSAVHGKDYFTFSMLDEEAKKKFQEEKYTSYGKFSFGKMGPRKRKRSITLDITLTYPELRDIFRRTAVAHIKSQLN